MPSWGFSLIGYDGAAALPTLSEAPLPVFYTKQPRPGKRLDSSSITSTMKKQRTKPSSSQRLWRFITKGSSRRHDPYLVNNILAFNFDGGWKPLLLKAQSKNT